MSQRQVWRKRSFGLAGSLRAQAKNWLSAGGQTVGESSGEMVTDVPEGRRKAGLRRRKY